MTCTSGGAVMRTAGRAPRHAIGVALGTADNAVVFAGLTVFIAFALSTIS